LRKRDRIKGREGKLRHSDAKDQEAYVSSWGKDHSNISFKKKFCDTGV
jgi:hypothetical protein